MKNWWKILIVGSLPALRVAAESFRNADENDTGKDDLIGVTLDYACDLLEWIIAPRTIAPPEAPNVLK